MKLPASEIPEDESSSDSSDAEMGSDNSWMANASTSSQEVPVLQNGTNGSQNSAGSSSAVQPVMNGSQNSAGSSSTVQPVINGCQSSAGSSALQHVINGCQNSAGSSTVQPVTNGNYESSGSQASVIRHTRSHRASLRSNPYHDFLRHRPAPSVVVHRTRRSTDQLESIRSLLNQVVAVSRDINSNICRINELLNRIIDKNEAKKD